jgi:hypothetical protein
MSATRRRSLRTSYIRPLAAQRPCLESPRLFPLDAQCRRRSASAQQAAERASSASSLCHCRAQRDSWPLHSATRCPTVCALAARAVAVARRAASAESFQPEPGKPQGRWRRCAAQTGAHAQGQYAGATQGEYGADCGHEWRLPRCSRRCRLATSSRSHQWRIANHAFCSVDWQSAQAAVSCVCVLT